MNQNNCAYSIKTSRVKEPDFPYHGQTISCTNELVEFAKSLQNADIEKMLVIYTDAQHHVICIQVMPGTVNQAVVYGREVIRHALLTGATGMVLVHNHPSNVPKPSDADIRLTRSIQEAGKLLEIKVHDHIILAGDRHYSFRDEGTVVFE